MVDACSKQELNDLPARLLDWFHILRSNNIRAKDATNKKSTLKEMSFLDAKLKAMCEYRFYYLFNLSIFNWLIDLMPFEENS